jgi:hypothetical protein
MTEPTDDINTLLKQLAVILPTLATKDDIARLEQGQLRLEQSQARLEDEQRQIKEVLGGVRLREVGRLDGRIDELTLVVTNALTHSEAAD